MTEFSSDKNAENKKEVIKIIKKSLEDRGYDLSRPKFGSYDSIQQSFTTPSLFKWKGKSHYRINWLVKEKLKECNKKMAEEFLTANKVKIKGKKSSIKKSGGGRALTVTVYRGCKKNYD